MREGLGVGEATIVFAYYKGAYGPTVGIDIQKLDRLRDIKTAIADLSKGLIQKFSMHDLPSVVMVTPLKSFTLLLIGSKDDPTRKKIKRLGKPDGSLMLQWDQTGYEWETTCELVSELEEIASEGLAGHQYLTDGSSDDVLVELAFKE